MGGHDLTGEQWAALARQLPPPPAVTVRPTTDGHLVMEATR